jgi:hypothetical protein
MDLSRPKELWAAEPRFRKLIARTICPENLGGFGPGSGAHHGPKVDFGDLGRLTRVGPDRVWGGRARPPGGVRGRQAPQ